MEIEISVGCLFGSRLNAKPGKRLRAREGSSEKPGKDRANEQKARRKKKVLDEQGAAATAAKR
jgi:hypothetical protein